jgi:hypothetical protein
VCNPSRNQFVIFGLQFTILRALLPEAATVFRRSSIVARNLRTEDGRQRTTVGGQALIDDFRFLFF